MQCMIENAKLRITSTFMFLLLLYNFHGDILSFLPIYRTTKTQILLISHLARKVSDFNSFD